MTICRLRVLVVFLCVCLSQYLVGALLVYHTDPPEFVVRRQLEALRTDDTQTAYQLASPSNKEVTGPHQKFAELVRADPFTPLIKHDKADILMTMEYTKFWRCLVRVWPEDTKIPKDYVYQLSRSKRDDLYFGCWLVDAVYPND
uniref:Uncharacterized protein n=1 Tax=Cyclophora tenuis TaxID=216820 RepID=A0A7S1GQR6_CYCTE